jgi:hypothetical protein
MVATADKVCVSVEFTIKPDSWYGTISNFIPVALETYLELREIAPGAVFYVLWNSTRVRIYPDDSVVTLVKRWGEVPR